MPLIEIADRQRRLLSFLNLVEAHVLAAIRREHNIALPKIRTALEFTQQRLSVAHPLATQQFETEGVDLFVRKLGELINVSRCGQIAMAEVLKRHLTPIERDTRGLPIKLYPFTRTAVTQDQPEMIVIDPRVSFGRPVLAGTGIPIAVLAERYKAGDSIEELAGDYGADRQAIEEAIRCELALAA